MYNKNIDRQKCLFLGLIVGLVLFMLLMMTIFFSFLKEDSTIVIITGTIFGGCLIFMILVLIIGFSYFDKQQLREEVESVLRSTEKAFDDVEMFEK